MTIVPSIATPSSERRIDSTAAWSAASPSPWPIVWAQAIAACSTTLRKSRERSESMDRWSVVRGTADRRQLAAGRTIGSEPEDVVGLHHLVDLAGAFVDHRPLAVAVEPADGVLVGVAVGAVHLHGISGGALGCHGSEPFREPG